MIAFFKIIFVSLGFFLISMLFLNLISYFKNRHFNKYITATVDNVDIESDFEMWSIKWLIPENIKINNPGTNGYQYFNFKVKHNQNFENLQERTNYLNTLVMKNTGTKFYLSLAVDKQGVVRDVSAYKGYTQKVLFYTVLNLIFFISIYFMNTI